MEIKAMEFPYTQNIDVVSKKQWEAHLKLYEGYITKTNEIESVLRKLRHPAGNATYSEIRGLLCGQSYAIDGAILHELYFGNIGGTEGVLDHRLTGAISEAFGSMDDWETDFKACANSARGWAILAFEQRTRSLVNILMDTHDSGYIAGAFPLVVLDMYEHAYFLDYTTNKDEYIKKFIKNINWRKVAQRIAAIVDL